MSEFKLHCRYSSKNQQSFFNDQGPQEYYGFLILNPELIPSECLYKADITDTICSIWIREDLIKRFNLNFETGGEYQFIMSLKDKRAAKFNIGKKNRMVLNSAIYFKNTIKKIGVWGSEKYFYERKENNENTGNSSSDGNKNNLGKIFLLSLPLLLIVLFFTLIIKWSLKEK